MTDGTLDAAIDEIRELKAEVARLREALEQIGCAVPPSELKVKDEPTRRNRMEPLKTIGCGIVEHGLMTFTRSNWRKIQATGVLLCPKGQFGGLRFTRMEGEVIVRCGQ